MKIYAKKPCNFNGKKYFIGDEIPVSAVLDPKAQQSMGIIEVVGENSVNRPESESADSNEGGTLLPPSSTLETDTEENTEEDTEEEAEEIEEEADVDTEEATYSKSTLVRMNRAELVEFATSKGIKTTEDMSKADIADLIIEKQGE